MSGISRKTQRQRIARRRKLAKRKGVSVVTLDRIRGDIEALRRTHPEAAERVAAEWGDDRVGWW